MKKVVLAVIACACLLPLANAATNPWFGTWKMDRSRSHLTGTTYTLSKSSDGMMHYKVGSGTDVAFRTDGKEYSVADNVSISAVQKSPGDITTTTKLSGKAYSSTRHQVSADGNTLTDTTTGTHPDGAAFTATVISKRVGSGTGMMGTWREEKRDSTSSPTFIISDAGKGLIKWESTAMKTINISKLDGSPDEITGVGASKDLVVVNKLVSPKKIEYTVQQKGKYVAKGSDTLSPDGKTMTEIEWSPGQESEKTTAIYVRQ